MVIRGPTCPTTTDPATFAERFGRGATKLPLPLAGEGWGEGSRSAAPTFPHLMAMLSRERERKSHHRSNFSPARSLSQIVLTTHQR